MDLSQFQQDELNRIPTILGACIPSRDFRETKEGAKPYIAMAYRIRTKLQDSDFRNLDWIINSAIQYFASTDGIINKPLLLQYLQQYGDKLIRSNRVNVSEILASRGTDIYLDLSSQGGFEQARNEVFSALSDYYDLLEEIEVTTEEFKSQLQLLAEDLFNEHQERILKEALLISTRGYEVWENGERTFKQGGKDSDDFYTRNIAYYRLKYLQENNLSIIDTSKDISELKQMHTEIKDTFSVVADLGVGPIDRAFGKFRKTKCLGIEGGASSGKTRLSRSITYRAATIYKQNVLDITLEQPRSEIWYIYVATHIFVKYGLYLPDSRIQAAEDLTDTEKHIIRLAEFDLWESGNYGKIRIESRNMNIEDSIEYLKSLKMTEFDYGVALVDYVGLVNSRDTNKYGTSDKYAIVTKFYQRFKKEICVELKVFGILLNQLGESGVKSLSKGDLTTTYDGSNSGETYKTPDYNLVIYQNEQLKEARKVQISLPKLRLGDRFYRLLVDTPLGVAHFSYEEEEDEYEKSLSEELATTEV